VGPEGAEVRSGSNWLLQLVDVESGTVLASAPAGSIRDIGHGAAYGVFFAVVADVAAHRNATLETRIFSSDSEATASHWAKFSQTAQLLWDSVPAAPATFTYNAGTVVQGEWRSTTRTVAFRPGAHGSLAGGTPDVVVTVSHGDPAPAAPAVTPEVGWQFTGWSPALPDTITADAETTAQYNAQTYTITFDTTGNGTLTGTLRQEVDHGGSTTPVMAIPGADSYVSRWTDGSTDNPRPLTNVTADAAYTAEFLILTPGDPNGDFELVYRHQSSSGLRKIWDFTGHYASAVGPYTLALDLVHDEKGAITGMGRFQGNLGGQPFDVGNLPVKAKAKGKGGVVTVKGSFKGVAGITSVSLKLTLTLDSTSLSLGGLVTGKLSDTAGASASVDSPVTLGLPVGMDGTYRLPVDLVLDATKGAVTGRSTLTLSNGRAAALLVKGKRAGGLTLLQFAGDKAADAAFGAIKLKLTVRTYSNRTADIQAMAGKAFGQSLKWPL
jgi:hypothetical protein